jgi:transposase
VRLSAGNENERRHLLPLIDSLAARGIRPRELWADRGYDSRALELELRKRGIEPHIPRRRLPGEPIPEGTPVREVWRGRRRYRTTRDAQAAQRWPIERTNAWLRNRRRVATRRDRKPELYEAFLQLAMILILVRAF